MNNYHIAISRLSRQGLIAALICLLSVPVLHAQTAAAASPRTRLSFDGGIFLGQRADFREIYNPGPTIEMDLDRYIGKRVNLGASGWFKHLNGDGGNTLRYLELALAPYATYTLRQRGTTRPYVGAGIGVAYRRIKMTEPPYYNDPSTNTVRWHDSEFSGFFLLISGLDLPRLGAFLPGLRLVYNFHFTGDPTVGDFGNTGGFTLLARVGFGL